MMFAPTYDAPFTETGKVVFERTYSRTKENGDKETWAETVHRVVTGNLKLVYGEPETWDSSVREEYDQLCNHIYNFKILPGGRHLWATGVGKRQYLANCHLASWGQQTSDHFDFSFMRLMEGGGVGANYSTYRHLQQYGSPKNFLKVHIVCDAEHKDYEKLLTSGVLSADFVSDWAGCYQIADSREGWAGALVDLIDTYWRTDVKHVDRVYDVSLVRPEGAKLRTFGGTASGPLPLAKMLHEVATVLNEAFQQAPWQTCLTPLQAMEIDHSIGQCVVAGGVRRSARMSILPWNDPFIFDFITCKSDPSKHWTTNISIEIDDEFLRQLNEPGSLARQVHHAAVKGMLKNGEPGYWNRSLSNVGEVDPIEGTNPCGEIPLNAWDVCNLGHVNMEAFWNADYQDLQLAHQLITRMLIRATFGDFTDPKQAAVVQRNRRIGVGHFGVQGFLVKNGIKYSKAPQSYYPALLRTLKAVVRESADDYAFELRIPAPIKTTTMAPTGSTAKMPGASEGGHPIYARWFIRRIRFSTLRPEETAQIEEYRRKGYHIEPDRQAANTVVVSIPTKERLVAEVEAMGFSPLLVESADEISMENMLAFQAMYQQCWADNAVSFTVNFPEGKYTVEQVSDALQEALPLLKGTTLMPDGTREQAPYERLTEAQYLALASDHEVAESYDEQCASGACPIR